MELNTRLLEQCRNASAGKRTLRGQEANDRRAASEKDREQIVIVAAGVVCSLQETQTSKVTSLSLVRYQTNDYSVPTEYGHRDVLVKGFVEEVVIALGSEVIARHPRSYEREDVIFEPRHYLALLEQKSNALDQAASAPGLEPAGVFRRGAAAAGRCG